LVYSKPHLGYKFLDLTNVLLYITQHVIFNENLFPYKHGLCQSSNFPTVPRDSSPAFPPIVSSPPREISHLSLPPTSSHEATCDSPPTLLPCPTRDTEFLPCPPRASSSTLLPTPLPILSSSLHEPVSPSSTCSSPHSHGPLTSPTTSSPHSPLSPTITPTFFNSQRLHPMVTRAQAHIHKPKLFIDCTIWYPFPLALTVSLDHTNAEPYCFSTAIKYAVWREAMATEFNALLKNCTWTLVPPQPSMNIVGCKWVFRIKRRADGSVDRYKAHLVAKSFHQQSRLDYAKTYGPVIKPVTIRTILSLAMSYGWSIKQIDVSNAFLHGFLNETVYMAQPPGFEHHQHPKSICLLKKAIYGLKQAPHVWLSSLSNRLLELGFIASKADSSLFLFTSA
jgi:hypothetical protein